jgi:hypothetical protein
MGEFLTFSTSDPRFRLMCFRFESRVRVLAHTGQYFCRGFTSRLRQCKQSRFTAFDTFSSLGSLCEENCDPLKRANRSLHAFNHSVNCAGGAVIGRLQSPLDCIQLSSRGMNPPQSEESAGDRSR